jgi:hypothetical protein
MASANTVLDREGEAAVTKAIRMALAGHPELFPRFQATVADAEASGSSLEACVVEAVELLVQMHGR